MAEGGACQAAEMGACLCGLLTPCRGGLPLLVSGSAEAPLAEPLQARQSSY